MFIYTYFFLSKHVRNLDIVTLVIITYLLSQISKEYLVMWLRYLLISDP